MKLTRLFLFAMGILLPVLAITAQVKTRTVEEYKHYENSPLEIIGLRVGDKTSTDAKSVAADKSWLGNLQVTLRNVSKKSIVYAEVSMVIPQQGELPSKISIPFEFRGIIAQREPGRQNEGLPGETLQMSMSRGVFVRWNEYFAQHKANDIEGVRWLVRMVQFNDGTAWAYGKDMSKDPEKKDSWIFVDSNSEQLLPS